VRWQTRPKERDLILRAMMRRSIPPTLDDESVSSNYIHVISLRPVERLTPWMADSTVAPTSFLAIRHDGRTFEDRIALSLRTRPFSRFSQFAACSNGKVGTSSPVGMGIHIYIYISGDALANARGSTFHCRRSAWLPLVFC